MLIALDAGTGDRVMAALAGKTMPHRCPGCGDPVVLRQGGVRAHHFAHRPGTVCPFAARESAEHMAAKMFFWHALRHAGRQPELEVDLRMPAWAPGEDRRADLLVTLPDGRRLAVEIQRTQVGADIIHGRTLSYAQLGIGVLWVPVLKAGTRFVRSAAADPGGHGQRHPLVARRYTAHAMEDWLDGLNFRQGTWYYHPGRDLVVRLTRHPSWIHREPTDFGAGGRRRSERWVNLHVEDAATRDGLGLMASWRSAYQGRNQSSFPAVWLGSVVRTLTPGDMLAARMPSSVPSAAHTQEPASAPQA